MSETHMALLADRGVVSVTGPDAAKLLQGLITNDLDAAREGAAIHAALLTPQGKILFVFFAVPVEGGFLLEIERNQAAALAKRLTFYKLRAAVTIEDMSDQHRVAVAWATALDLPPPLRGRGGEGARAGSVADDRPPTPPRKGEGSLPAGIRYADARDPRLGTRLILDVNAPAAPTATSADYHAHRIALGVPEAGLDYPLGDAFPHEAGLDLFHGVDFDKGCFVGQEVVARMQHKTVVRKRVVRVSAVADLPTDNPEVTVGPGDAIIGRLGSVAGGLGLALLRLDRAAEALDHGDPIETGGHLLTVDPEAIAAYRAAVTSKAATP